MELMSRACCAWRNSQNFVNMASIDDLKLINLYEKRPLLWDTRLDDYYSSVEQRAVLRKEIADEMGNGNYKMY